MLSLDLVYGTDYFINPVMWISLPRKSITGVTVNYWKSCKSKVKSTVDILLLTTACLNFQRIFGLYDNFCHNSWKNTADDYLLVSWNKILLKRRNRKKLLTALFDCRNYTSCCCSLVEYRLLPCLFLLVNCSDPLAKIASNN